MTTTTQIQSLAEEARAWFVQKERAETEKEFWTTKNTRPDWVQNMCREAHGDMLPDDYRYQYIVDALDIIIDADDDQDLEELADEIEADVYNSDLLRWLSSDLERSGYVDEATEEFGHSPDMGLMGDIMMGQQAEKQEVYRAVLHFLVELHEEDEEDAE